MANKFDENFKKVTGVITDPLGATRSVAGDVATGVKSWGNDAARVFPGLADALKVDGGMLAPPNLKAMPTITPTSGAPVGVPGLPGTPGGLSGNLGIGSVSGATIDPTAGRGMASHQNALATQLAGMVAGTAPSLAEAQARSTMNQGIAQQFALANSARGGNNAAAGRQAMANASDMTAQMTSQAAQARLAEQIQAGGLLGQVSTAARGQDLQLATDQAKLAQEAVLKNADMETTRAQLAAQYAAMGLDAAKANQMADIEIQKLIQAGVIAENDMTVRLDANNKAMIGAGLGAIGSGIGVAAASDRSLKTDVKDGAAPVRAFLDTVTVNDYKYKDEKFGKGRFVSAMAQDLLKTPLGKDMVVPTEEGLMVDYGKGFGTMLAAQADLHKRLKNLEKKKK